MSAFGIVLRRALFVAVICLLQANPAVAAHIGLYSAPDCVEGQPLYVNTEHACGVRAATDTWTAFKRGMAIPGDNRVRDRRCAAIEITGPVAADPGPSAT